MLFADHLITGPSSVHGSFRQAIRKAIPLIRISAVLILQAIFLVMALAFAGRPARGTRAAEPRSPTPAGAAATSKSVRSFMQIVAHDVTQDGPLAWLKFFDDGPQFFMAVNGQLAFPNATAADK